MSKNVSVSINGKLVTETPKTIERCIRPALKGPQGQKGKEGEIGPQGVRGPVGERGPRGGPQGKRGFRGDRGEQGAQGDAIIGPQGFQGGVTGTVFYVETSDSATGPPLSAPLPMEVGDTLRLWSAGGIEAETLPGSVLLNIEPANILLTSGFPTSPPKDPTRPVIYIDDVSGELYSWNPNLGSGGGWVAATSGVTGAQGTQGETGIQGFQGAHGETGSQGADGAQGYRGDTGTQGLRGETGPVDNPASFVCDVFNTVDVIDHANSESKMLIKGETALNAITSNDYLCSIMQNASEQGWELVWSDEFTQSDSAPDNSNWNFDIGGDGWGKFRTSILH